jgi:hypothetical protein
VYFLHELREENKAVGCVGWRITICICALCLFKKEELCVEIYFHNHTLRQLRQLRQNSAIDIFLTGEKELSCGMMCRRCTVTISSDLLFLLKNEDLHVEKTVKPILSATNLVHFWRSWRAQLALSIYFRRRMSRGLISYGVRGVINPFPAQCKANHFVRFDEIQDLRSTIIAFSPPHVLVSPLPCRFMRSLLVIVCVALLFPVVLN